VVLLDGGKEVTVTVLRGSTGLIFRRLITNELDLLNLRK